MGAFFVARFTYAVSRAFFWPFLGLAWCMGRTRAKKQVPNQWNFPRLLNRSQRARGLAGLPVSSESYTEKES